LPDYKPSGYDTEMTTPSSEYPGSAPPHSAPHPDAGHALPAPRHIPPGVRIAAIVLLLVVVVGIAYRLLARVADEHSLENATHASAVPTVIVVTPSITGATSEIELPGNTQAFDDTPIYARTSGYLKKWYVDIGQHVTKGELMATI